MNQEYLKRDAFGNVSCFPNSKKKKVSLQEFSHHKLYITAALYTDLSLQPEVTLMPTLGLTHVHNNHLCLVRKETDFDCYSSLVNVPDDCARGC